MNRSYIRNISKVLKSTANRIFGAGADGVPSELTSASARTILDVYSTSQVDTALLGKADLSGGLIPSSQIPAIAITEYLGSVANQSAMLALVGDRGDWCLRSDTGTTWVLANDDSSLLASWIELNYPTAPVTSVNGETGAVTLSAADVGAATSTTTITAGTGLSGGGDLSANRTINLANTAVTAGSYTFASITVDAQGRLTAASSGSAVPDYTSDAELNAIAGLSSSANTGIRFTGAGTAELFSITDTALTILDDTTTDAMLTTLAGGNAPKGTGGIMRTSGPEFTGTLSGADGDIASNRIAAGGAFRFRRANGSIESPTGVLSSNFIGLIGGLGWHSGGAYHTGWGAYISFVATENFTSTAEGTDIRFVTTQNGTTTNTEVMRITQGKRVGIKVTSEPTTDLDINSDCIRLRTAKTPASASATANQGEIGWDTDAIYVSPATNTWKKTPLIPFTAGIQTSPAFLVDRYYSGYASQQPATLVLTGNVLTYVPIVIPFAFSATRIGINVTTSSAGGARLGIYNDASGVPAGSPLLDAGAVDTGTTGEKELTIAQTLSPGLYWLAMATNSVATVTAENLGTTGINIPNLGCSAGNGNCITHLTQSHTYGALPSVGTLTAVTTKTPPRIWLRNYTPPALATIVSSSVNNTYPAGIAAGDLIFVWIDRDQTMYGAQNTISGFTSITSGATGSNSVGRLQVKTATGSESGTINPTVNWYDNWVVACVVVRGGSTAKVVAALNTNSLTVSHDSSKVIVMGWSNGDADWGDVISAPSGYTDYANSTRGFPGIAVIAKNDGVNAGAFSHTVTITGWTIGRIVFSVGPA